MLRARLSCICPSMTTEAREPSGLAGDSLRSFGDVRCIYSYKAENVSVVLRGCLPARSSRSRKGRDLNPARNSPVQLSSIVQRVCRLLETMLMPSARVQAFPRFFLRIVDRQSRVFESTIQTLQIGE